MSRKKTKVIPFVIPDGEIQAPPPIAELPAPRYVFERKPRCPRCGGMDTVPTGTHDGVQHRLCRAPICRRAFKVQGRSI